MTGYERYRLACFEIASLDSLFQRFKQISEYNHILEHVTPEQGLDYLKEVLQLQVAYEDILAYCKQNDSVGKPLLCQYSPDLICSPTSLRYVFHANLILRHIKQLGLQTVKIVEVGGGYGGLLLAIHFFAPKYGIQIQKYTILDLHEVTFLQKKYLSLFPVVFPYSVQNGESYGKEIEETDLFFISNYCLSEVPIPIFESYVRELLPKCSHGFLAWNMRPYVDFGKQARVEPEVPFMSENNRMVYF